MGPDDLLITASTLGNPPFPTLVHAAAAGGFTGLSIWPEATYRRARRDGLSAGDQRQLLADHGLVVNDVDALVAWAGPGDPGPPYLEEPDRDTFLEAAEALGASRANVLLLGRPGASLEAAAEAYAGVCDLLGEHGLIATLEYSARGAVSTFADAVRVVKLTGRSNARIMVDTWHHHWGGSEEAGFDVDDGAGELIGGVQVNDAPAERPADINHASRYQRLAPGDGAVDLVAFVRDLRAAGCQEPLTVEVFNDPLVERHGVDAWARLLGERIRDVVEQAAAL